MPLVASASCSVRVDIIIIGTIGDCLGPLSAVGFARVGEFIQQDGMARLAEFTETNGGKLRAKLFSR